MKYIRQSDALREVTFHENQMKERYAHLKEWRDSPNEDGTEKDAAEFMEYAHDNALDYFRITKHGIKDHLERFETVEGFAERLRVKEETINKLIQQGKIKVEMIIPPSQFGELSRDEFLKMIREADDEK